METLSLGAPCDGLEGSGSGGIEGGMMMRSAFQRLKRVGGGGCCKAFVAYIYIYCVYPVCDEHPVCATVPCPAGVVGGVGAKR